MAYCWGCGNNSQLGNGGTADQESPVPVDTTPLVGSKRFLRIDGGAFHACAITVEGDPYCWGSDTSGQLGNGLTAGAQASPVPVDTAPMSGCKKFVQPDLMY